MERNKIMLGFKNSRWRSFLYCKFQILAATNFVDFGNFIGGF